jgi:hypothetical protein
MPSGKARKMSPIVLKSARQKARRNPVEELMNPHQPLPRLAALVLALSSFGPARADESTYTLEPVIFRAQASFESLGEETYVPKTVTPIQPSRASVLKRIGDDQAFPIVNLGYPAGASGVRLGGRSVDDTQVTTLGVPLNLPQGGGADLSIFPSFLWSAAELSRTPVAGGYAPTSASGAINLRLWTRDRILRRHRADDPDSRLTANYDRQVQTFSIATERPGIAINVGSNFGLLTGPAGSLSYEFYRDSDSTWRLHLLGTDQRGDNPGSRRFPTPNAKIDNWRAIPVLEMQRSLGRDWVWEATAFGDLSGLRLLDPTDPSGNSSSRSKQFGLENAFLYQDWTIAVSARLVQFDLEANEFTDAFGGLNRVPGAEVREWPLFASVTRRFDLSDRFELKATALGSAITSVGAAPGGRLSARLAADPAERDREYTFFELLSTPKMPTINARYYQYLYNGTTSYAGNPDLKPEQIYAAIAGYERRFSRWSTRSSLKGEYRTAVQIDRGSTTVNAGTARLLYLDQEINWAATGRLDLRANLLFTVSHLQDANIPYPDLPAFSTRGRAIYHFSPSWELEGRAWYQGPSVATAGSTGGRFHPNFALFDLEGRVMLARDLNLQLGIENLTNQFAELVLDYPMPGRLYYAGLQLAL